MTTYKAKDVIETLGLEYNPKTNKLKFKYENTSLEVLIANLSYYSKNGGDDKSWLRIREHIENLMIKASRRLSQLE